MEDWLKKDKIAADLPFHNEWKRKDMEKTHKEEIKISCILTSQLMKHNMFCRRTNLDPYTPVDLSVVNFDYNHLREGGLVCKIDIESKPIHFIGHGSLMVPGSWVRGISIVERKVAKVENFDRDLWVSFDLSKYPRPIAVPYSIIRDFGVFEDQSRRHPHDNPLKWQFRLIKQRDYDKVLYSWDDIVKWCKKLQNKEVITNPNI
jgi:hypothetical protein